MLMRKEKKGMKFTTVMTLDMIFVAMIILDIFILQMTLAMVIVNLASFIWPDVLPSSPAALLT